MNSFGFEMTVCIPKCILQGQNVQFRNKRRQFDLKVNGFGPKGQFLRTSKQFSAILGSSWPEVDGLKPKCTVSWLKSLLWGRSGQLRAVLNSLDPKWSVLNWNTQDLVTKWTVECQNRQLSAKVGHFRRKCSNVDPK